MEQSAQQAPPVGRVSRSPYSDVRLSDEGPGGANEAGGSKGPGGPGKGSAGARAHGGRVAEEEPAATARAGPVAPAAKDATPGVMGSGSAVQNGGGTQSVTGAFVSGVPTLGRRTADVRVRDAVKVGKGDAEPVAACDGLAGYGKAGGKGGPCTLR